MLYTSIFSPLIPLSILLSKIKQPKEKAIWIIFIYIFYSFSTDLILFYWDQIGELPETVNRNLSSLFTVVEFVCFGLFFYFTLKRKNLRNLVLSGIVIIASFLIANIFFQFIKFENLDSIPITVQGLFIMPLALVYYFEQIKNPDALFIYGTPNFWIVTGILIYLAGTFFIFILSENLTEKELDYYWPINYFFNTIKNLMFGLAFYMYSRKQNHHEKDNTLLYST